MAGALSGERRYFDMAGHVALTQQIVLRPDGHGMWRNIIDRPGAYPEYSATAMIATALLRGIRNG